MTIGLVVVVALVLLIAGASSLHWLRSEQSLEEGVPAPDLTAWRQGNTNAPPACESPAVQLTHDYAFLVGSAEFTDPEGDPESGSGYRWLIDGTPLTTTQPLGEGLLLHFDASAAGANGEMPSLAEEVAYAPGKWGRALALPEAGNLEFARQGNLFLDEGTIEMWIALQADGSDPAYAEWQALFYYEAPNGDYFHIAQSEYGALFGGGNTSGEWQGAGHYEGSVQGWQAGEWHHLALTYSASGNFLRFYLDGQRLGESDGYRPPSAEGSSFSAGGCPWLGAAYRFDELHFFGRAATDAEIATRASRLDPIQPNEAWLPTSALAPGTNAVYEFTPATASETGAPRRSAALTYPGIPVFDPNPPSTLLAPGATSFELSVESLEGAACAYAVGEPLAYSQMTPFDQGAGTVTHTTTVSGLNPDPNTINDVYVRCASHPDFFLSLRYRSLSQVNPGFPRTGNLWGWWQLVNNGRPLEHIAGIDLWLGVDISGDAIRQLRQLNPDIRVLTSINAVEDGDNALDDPRCNGCTGDACEDWYLHDVNGDRIEVWPGSWRINLTNEAVAEYQACYAYQTLLDSGLMADGVFFDNVMTAQSWLTEDIYGNTVQIDADNDGIADDPAALDAAWKAGVFHEIETFRELAPHAIVSGHAMHIAEPGVGELFDGISLGFQTADVLGGQEVFANLWDLYADWMSAARQPPTVMFESSPLDQIAYGYDYEPLVKIPASTLEFARTYYPWMRFGLALTLMNDGYFAHEFGDTWHGNDWWYDELDFDLGYPLGPAQRVDMGFDPGPDQIVNGSFETPLAAPWDFWADSDAGCKADVTRDLTTAAAGSASARIVITATPGADWHVDFSQDNRSLQNGVVYDLTFWAKADRPRSLILNLHKNSPDWDNYGLWREVALTADWQPYTVTFQAAATADDARIQFLAGTVTGTVWLDDVRLTLHPPDVFRRAYTHGLVLLNGTNETQTVTLEPGYRRLSGTQAPLVELLLDDSGPGFALLEGMWIPTTYDSGEWMATGPFYHDWGDGLHQLASSSGQARWDLPITASDLYTITAWWPAAPEAATWNPAVRFEIVAGGQVVLSTTLDQSTGGDEWHLVGVAQLSPGDTPFVRIVCSGGSPCVADALHLRSSARYNNGQPAASVTLQPLDGIILQRLAQGSRGERAHP
ncbi:MAG: putative glycoside hydrolase [Anaerolineales bacterium]|nr:putative glycoside hydrolase [Anaerolineales bacterium]